MDDEIEVTVKVSCDFIFTAKAKPSELNSNEEIELDFAGFLQSELGGQGELSSINVKAEILDV